MLNEIRRVFRKSINSFLSEVSSSEPEDEVAELLTAMRRELVAARAALPEYEEHVAATRQAVAKEAQQVEQCERRKRMAEAIGDLETAGVAEEYAEKHRARLGVLERKVETAQAELDMRRREADEMLEKFRHADANRFALVAQLRMRSRSGSMSSDDAFADFARMEERVDFNADFASAMEELGDEPVADERPSPAEVEARLQELKRRMGRQ